MYRHLIEVEYPSVREFQAVPSRCLKTSVLDVESQVDLTCVSSNNPRTPAERAEDSANHSASNLLYYI